MGLRAEAVKLYQPEIKIPFPAEEYERRRAAVREAMTRQKIDLLYCTAPESLFYLTGYDSNQFQQESPRGVLPISGVAIKRDEEKAIFFDSEEEEIKTRSYTIAVDIRIHRHESPISELEFIVKSLKEEGWLKGTVGLEKWSNRPNPAVCEMFQAALGKEGCRVVDGSDIVREVRVIKSPQEMAYTRTAAKIADIGLRAAVEHIKPGMTEIDVRAEVDYACAKAGGETPGEPVFLLAGQRTAHPHAPASRQVIMHGDIVRIDLCGVYHRYHAVVARTLSIGEPHPKMAKRIELSAKSCPVLLETIKPNRPISEVNKAVEEYAFA